MIALRGITWDHARGFDPLAAASALYAEQNPGVSAAWERRSLQAFGDMPLSMLADRFDLMVIDHPHIGEATSQGLLVPLDGATHAAAIEDLARNSIGPSHASYRMGGRQWALAIDAAAQVAAHRPDRLSTIPRSWDEVASLAREARVIWPLKPVDAIDSFFTLAANIGKPVGRRRDRLIERDSGLMILNLMREIAVMVPSECLRWSPIEALEALASDEGRFAYCPLLFGYTNYSRRGFRNNLVAFGDIPALGESGPAGSILGGTGIAVSSRSAHRQEAIAFAHWLASRDVQRGIYVKANGQPAHTAAWNDPAADRLCGGFFSGVRTSMDLSWLRPRYAGFLPFVDETGDLINDFLRGLGTAEATLDGFEASYARSLVGAENEEF